MTMTMTAQHPVVSRDEWLEARKSLLQREKELTRLRDQLSAERRGLPWVRIDEPYVFEGPQGRRTLAELLLDGGAGDLRRSPRRRQRQRDRREDEAAGRPVT